MPDELSMRICAAQGAHYSLSSVGEGRGEGALEFATHHYFSTKDASVATIDRWGVTLYAVDTRSIPVAMRTTTSSDGGIVANLDARTAVASYRRYHRYRVNLTCRS